MYITSLSCPNKIKLPIRPVISAILQLGHGVMPQLFSFSNDHWKYWVLNCEGSMSGITCTCTGVFLSFWAYLGIRKAYCKRNTNKSVLWDDNDKWDAKRACSYFLQALNCTEFERMDNNNNTYNNNNNNNN